MKKLLKIVISALAVTTALGLGADIVSHDIQMYALSGLVLYMLWFKR